MRIGLRLELRQKFLLSVSLLRLIRRETLQMLLDSLLLVHPAVRVRSIRALPGKVHVECLVCLIVADGISKTMKILVRSM